jgi:hypothetical protein
VDPRADLDDVEKILDPTRTRTPTSSLVQPVASRYTDCAIAQILNNIEYLIRFMFQAFSFNVPCNIRASKIFIKYYAKDLRFLEPWL